MMVKGEFYFCKTKYDWFKYSDFFWTKREVLKYILRSKKKT